MGRGCAVGENQPRDAPPSGWMWRRHVYVRAIGLVLLGSFCSVRVALPGRSPSIVAIRHFASSAHTRLVVELSDPAAASISSLPPADAGKPRRIYLDLPGVRVAPRIDKSQDLPKGPLAAVRIGKRDLDTLRVVIALRNAEGYQASRLSGPPRIVIDIRGAAESDERRDTPRAVRDSSRREATQIPAGGGSRAATAAKSRPIRPQRSEGPSLGAGTGGPRGGPSSPPRLKIVIDPGHGGKDPGARGVGGVLEKAVVLAIARRLARRLEDDPGASVVLTRNGDKFVPLEARTARANAERADLFISIHANASTSSRLAGVETYYLNNTNDRATVRLAAMENGLQFIGGTPGRRDLSYILSDLVQQGKLEDSISLSKALHTGLVARLQRAHPDVTNLGVKQGPFYVLVGAHMPCVLVEVAFLTHPVEGKRLATAAYQQAIADGLAAGVRRYVKQLQQAHTL